MMKLKKYIKFVKEAIREDENSYLNDLGGERWDDSTYGPEDEYGYEEQGDDYSDEEGMSELIDLFNRLFDNHGIYGVDIEGTPKEINMYFTLKYKERLRTMVSIFEVLSKIKKDILPQFDSETDLWIDRKEDTVLSVIFEYNQNLESGFPF